MSTQAQLPDVSHIDSLELYGTGELPEHTIHNRPGEEKVLAVYYKLALDCGGVTPDAAQQGVDLLEPLASDDPSQRGLDLLRSIAQEGRYLAARIVKKG